MGSKTERPDELQLPQTEAKIYPKISLEREHQRQSQGFIKLGFHRELGLTEEEYLRSLPRFTSQPENFKGRLDTPVIIETRIPIIRQCELVGINYFYKHDVLDKASDWSDDPGKYRTPDFPYTVWTDEGARNMNRKAEDVRKELRLDERGGTELDAIGLYIAKPNILRIRFLDLPGTSYGPLYIARLDLWNGREPWMQHRLVDHANPNFGSMLCGRQ